MYPKSAAVSYKLALVWLLHDMALRNTFQCHIFQLVLLESRLCHFLIRLSMLFRTPSFLFAIKRSAYESQLARWQNSHSVTTLPDLIRIAGQSI